MNPSIVSILFGLFSVAQLLFVFFFLARKNWRADKSDLFIVTLDICMVISSVWMVQFYNQAEYCLIGDFFCFDFSETGRKIAFTATLSYALFCMLWIKPNEHAIQTFFGERTGESIKEGMVFAPVIPFFGTLLRFGGSPIDLGYGFWKSVKQEAFVLEVEVASFTEDHILVGYKVHAIVSVCDSSKFASIGEEGALGCVKQAIMIYIHGQLQNNDLRFVLDIPRVPLQKNQLEWLNEHHEDDSGLQVTKMQFVGMAIADEKAREIFSLLATSGIQGEVLQKSSVEFSMFAKQIRSVYGEMSDELIITLWNAFSTRNQQGPFMGSFRFQ